MSVSSSQARVFISYASADKEKAEQICQELESRGHLCWIAPRNVRAGRDYAEEIMIGIRESRCMVLVLSQAANESPFVKREVERAVSMQKPVFPIRVEDTLPSPQLELFVSASHWVDAWSGDFVKHINRLARDLSDDHVVEQVEGVATKANRMRKRPRWVLLGGIVGSLIIGVLLVKYLFFRSGATQTPVAIEETLETMAKTAEGIDFESLKKGDIELAIEPDRVDQNPPAYSIRLSLAERGRSKLRYNMVRLAIGERAPEELKLFAGKIPSSFLDQNALRSGNALSISIKSEVSDAWTETFVYEYNLETEVANAGLSFAKRQDRENPPMVGPITGLYKMSYRLTGEPETFSKLYIGESPEALDRVLDLREAAAAFDGTGIGARAFGVYNIPIRSGSKSLSTQLEFSDGSKGTVHSLEIDPPAQVGVILSEREVTPSEGTGPTLLVSYRKMNPIELFYRLASPVEASELRYALDEGRFARAKLNEKVVPYNWFEFRGPVGTSSVTLSYQNGKGETVGPLVYQMGDSTEIVKETHKARFLKNPEGYLRAFEIREEHVDGSYQPTGSGERKFQEFFVQEQKPQQVGVYIIPDEIDSYGTADNWIAVDSLRLGSVSGKLDTTIPVNLNMETFLTKGKVTYKMREELFQARLPLETQAVYAKFVFFDGSESDEYWIPIVQ